MYAKPTSPMVRGVAATLLRKHVLDFFIAEEDLVDGVASALERFEVAVDVGGEEDLWIPFITLRTSYTSNQTRRSIRVTDIDNSMLLFGKRRAQQARSPVMASRLGRRG